MSLSIDYNSDFYVKQLTNKHSSSIKKIWLECFTPDIRYIDSFLKQCFPYSISWGVFPKNSDEAVAMLSLLPSYSIIIKDNGSKLNLNGSYVYGVGTLEQHRGKGYSKILMDQAISFSKKKFLDYMLVKPAQDSLFDLYQKQSFNHILSCYSLEIDILEISKNTNKISGKNCQFKKCNDSLFHLQARESNSEKNFLWPVEILNYSVLEIDSRGGVTEFYNEQSKENNNVSNNEDSPLFYSAYPIEESAQIVKVSDHNIKSIQELECVIDNLATSFSNVRKVQMEFSITCEPHMFSTFSNKSTITKNALIKILNPDAQIESRLLKMYLPQSME